MMTIRHLSDTEIGMKKVPLLANALQRNQVLSNNESESFLSLFCFSDEYRQLQLYVYNSISSMIKEQHILQIL